MIVRKQRMITIKLEPFNQYAEIARAYFKMKRVYRYHMKKISDMSDNEVIQKCHWWYTENHP